MLRGIIPILFTPFNLNSEIDEEGLRNIIRFELEGGIHGIGINGFASEAYKLTDDERRRTVAIVADEVSNQVPLVIGIAPGSIEAAIQQANEFAKYHPAALMVLPPSTMKMQSQDLIEHYVTLGQAADAPIMVQQSPHIQQYNATRLSAESLAEIATRSANVQYFNIEGPGSAERIAELQPFIQTDQVGLFGGGGGITFLAELKVGVSGLIPGVGFNERFVEIWDLWDRGKINRAEELLLDVAPLVTAISGSGHEFSLHARKHLMQCAGYIRHPIVRRPTVSVTTHDLQSINTIADKMNLRISQNRRLL